MKTGSIRLFGKNIASSYNHYIMSLSYSDLIQSSNLLSMECVTDKADKLIDGTYSVNTAKNLLKANRGLCDDLFFVMLKKT